jgi:predicted nucleic acid-binding Zn ribbon protein
MIGDPCVRCGKAIPPGKNIASKRYCSQECQQLYNTEKSRRQRDEALRLQRYMEQYLPKALKQIRTAMAEAKGEKE